jgi:nitrogen fixation/metabolism regulation signal transduction histidine kinase
MGFHDRKLTIVAVLTACIAGDRPRVLILFSNDWLLPASQAMEQGFRQAFTGEDGGSTELVNPNGGPCNASMTKDITDDGAVDISVSDSGPSIPPHLIKRIFGKYFTTKRDGMRLGLALSRSIAESQGG